MGGELNRINPTVVEGAEDIMGAEDASFKADTFKFNWNERNQNPRNRPARRMTEKQFSDLQRMQRMGRSMGFRAEGMGQKMSQGQFEALRRMVQQQQSGRSVIRGDMSRMLRRDLRRAEYLGNMEYMQGRILEEERRKNRDAKDAEYDDDDDDLTDCQVCGEMFVSGALNQHPTTLYNVCYGCFENELEEDDEGWVDVRDFTWDEEDYDAESFEANETDANMVSEGSVDAFYGGGAKVSVSSAGIQPTANPSVDEAFDVGNQVGLDVAEQEVMNENPSVEVNYGAEGDVVDLTQELASKVGFRLGGMSASALVLGVAALAGYRYARR